MAKRKDSTSGSTSLEKIPIHIKIKIKFLRNIIIITTLLSPHFIAAQFISFLCFQINCSAFRRMYFLMIIIVITGDGSHFRVKNTFRTCADVDKFAVLKS